MKTKPSFVFDTNVLISAFLLPHSISREALNHATLIGDLAISDAAFIEFSEVLFRKKFDKYFLYEEERMRIIDKLKMNTFFFSTSETIRVCKDPKDDIFLELAISARAACLITGDRTLLELHPFREIPILTPSDFILTFNEN